MAFQHQLQQNRFELKYVIDEALAKSLREFCRSYLEPDEHADTANNFSYSIHSVYLDGPGFDLFRSTIHGLKNRYKLRIRYYDEWPDSPAWFEIKRRINDVILKKRAAVKRSSVPRLLEEFWPEMSDMAQEDDLRGFESLRHFCDLARGINAQGRVIVSYIREAWVTPQNNAVRMTFDRNLIATRFDKELVVPDFRAGLSAQPRGAILELKFTDRFPNWMRNMAQVFGLQRRSMAKYCECMQVLNLRELREQLPELGVAL